MGFFQGRVTCCRFKVSKSAPRQFGPDHLEKLANAAIGQQRIATADGTEVAKDRLEQEAKDGRFLKRRATEILWDGLSNELLVATSSAGVLDRLHALFKQTFDRSLDFLGAGRQAFLWSEVDARTRTVDDAT